MPRLILALRPGVRTASAATQAASVDGVVGTTEASVANAVIVDVDRVTDDLKRRLAELPGVDRVEDDIQAIPQVQDEEAVRDFLDRVKARRGEEHVPPLFETKPVRRDDVRTDGGQPTVALDAPPATPGPQASIASIDDSIAFAGGTALHAEGIRGASVIAVNVDTGACGSAIESSRQLAGADLSDENNPYSQLGPHGPYTLGIMAGDSTTPGVNEGYVPDADVFPIKTTLASSEIIQAQDIIVQLAEDTGKHVVVNNCLTADAMVSTVDGPKPIVDVEVGDRVYACDIDVRGQQVCEVTDTFESGEKEVYDLRTRTRSVRASDNHPFLVADQDQQRLVWKALEDLAPGDLIAIRRENTAGAGKPHRFVEADGGQATISGGPDVRLDGKTSSKGCKVPKETTREFCQWTPEMDGFVFDRVVAIDAAGVEPTYDIEVAGAHNFVANGILLHNSWGFVECEGLCGLTVTQSVEAAAQHPLVTQVFAAGNQATGDPGCGQACDGSTIGITGPASLDSVLSVAASGNNGDTGVIQPYSSRGAPGAVSCGTEKPDISAPIFGTVPWGCSSTDIGNSGGTSGACPQVAGTVALLIDAFNQRGTDFTRSDVFGAIETTAQQYMGSGFSGCSGWGNVQAAAAADIQPALGAGLSTESKVIVGLVALGFAGAALRRAMAS